MTKYGIVFAFETDSPEDATLIRQAVEASLDDLVAPCAQPWLRGHITMHKDTRPDGATPYPPFVNVTTDERPAD